ncbi:MAG TPA: mandelate racemase/muconate lactonizing enzyme family protein [Stellaceae bacterium]|jgi:L-alanine-DL-glutamate epimerase-like enolase superfamily enzyme|nr:mandelate racemase/muconate lactonizing enzyme family protein [Stellaceae bacterium]
MRIDKVEAIPIEVPLRKVFSGSGYRVDSRCTVVTRIRTADGLASEVYNGDNRAHAAAIARIVEDELAPLLIGEDASKIERLWAKMFPLAHPNRDRKLVMEAIACVDTALWDLFGKSLGANVATLLGGFRDRLPIIAIAGYYEEGKTPADLGREMEWLRGAGMAGCKVKVGGLSAAADAERVAACRAGAGLDFILAVDANRGWATSEAIKFARQIERYEIRWFEEPCHWYDEAAGMAEVRRRTTIPINAGQSEISVHGVRRLIAAGAVDLINFDASEAGGITEWRRAAALCAVHGIEMAHHEEPQISTQMLAAVPHGTYVECFPDPERDPLWAGMIRNRAPIKNGIIEVPHGPGFGLELDWDLIGRYRLDR